VLPETGWSSTTQIAGTRTLNVISCRNCGHRRADDSASAVDDEPDNRRAPVGGRCAIMTSMWTPDDVAQLTEETTQGSLDWQESSDGALHIERGEQALTLQRDEDDRLKLTGVDGMEVTVLADALDPLMTPGLTALWDAAVAGMGYLR
jgi:hypothetical protein